MKKVLVIGGTGTLGKVLVGQLASKGYIVRVLARKPQKAAFLPQDGIEVVPGDLLDKGSLLEACQGMEGVVSAAHSMLGRGRYASEQVDVAGQKALIDAAREAGVPYFVFLSVVGAAPDHKVDFWRSKWQIEQYLIQSGLAYNIIRATAFMEVHIREMLGKSILKNGKVMIFGKGDKATNFVSVKDVARLILHCFEHPEHHNRIFEIGGRDNISRLDIINRYSQKLGKPVLATHMPNGVLRVLSKVIRPFHPGISRVMFIADLFDQEEQCFEVEPLLREVEMEVCGVEEVIGG
ncbi:MAG: SDR family oxidoreductase [Saprospiraceae bacterium]|nr:SDR family oxidoreductase [Saprospiraceae bacterium]